MKKELPIAVCLLALGVVLFWNASGRSRGRQFAENFSGPATDVLSADVALEPAASFLNILQRADDKQDRWCQSALISIGQALNQLPSIAVRTRLESHMHGIAMLAQGKFFQTENGRKSRLEINFDDPQSPLSVLQICDGQFSYKLHTSGKQQRLEFVDLSRLENKEARLSDVVSPTGWVMGGGLGATLIHCAEAFHFQVIDTGGPEKLHLRGVWDNRQLLSLLYPRVDKQNRPTEVQWDKLPGYIPHAVEIVFSKLGGEVMQPEKIAFLRFTNQQGRAVAENMIRIQFEVLNVSEALPPALFTIESRGFEAIEVTDDYNQTISALNVGVLKVASEVVQPNAVSEPVR